MKDFSILSWKKRELALVFGILLVTATISLVQLKTSEMKTRDAQRKADVELIGRALQAYLVDYGKLPLEATGEAKILQCGERGVGICEWGNSAIVDEKNQAYLAKVPQDPLANTSRTYIYKVNKDRTKFVVYVALEYPRDISWKKDLTVMCGNNVQCNWYVEN